MKFSFIMLFVINTIAQVQNRTNYLKLIKEFVGNLELAGYDWLILISCILLIICYFLFKKRKYFYKISFGYFTFILIIYLISFLLNYEAFIDIVNIGHFSTEQIPMFYAVSATTPLLFTLYSFIYIIILYKK